MAAASNQTAIIFNEEELKGMSGFEKGPNNSYIEVLCGATSKRLGDTMGKLRVSMAGDFVVYCDCPAPCRGKKFTPNEFEKHSGRGGSIKWKHHIWVVMGDKKVPLYRTCLIKYHNRTNEKKIITAHKKFHRDEFIRCSTCSKERRFRLRSKDECRLYHDALIANNWECADWPFDEISCEVAEERTSRRSSRGCPKAPTCEGCTSCVCFGCIKCRFDDCNCRTCVDYVLNAANQA